MASTVQSKIFINNLGMPDLWAKGPKAYNSWDQVILALALEFKTMIGYNYLRKHYN